jgi:hypothetical protein
MHCSVFVLRKIISFFASVSLRDSIFPKFFLTR